MKRSEAAVRYAKALFGLAEEKKLLNEVDGEFAAFAQSAAAQPAVLRLVQNPVISSAEKETFIEQIAGKGSEASRLLLSFLKVLLHKKRFSELPGIQAEFHQLVESAQGVQEVRVITAVPMTEPHQNRLSAHLAKKLDAKIRMIPEIRPEIMGGMILRFGNQQINASYRHRLETIRQRLLAR